MAIRELPVRPFPLLLGAFVVMTLSLTIALLFARSFPTSFGRRGVHAVFLENGQVYFGRVRGENLRSLTLGDIYYFKISGAPNAEQDLAKDENNALVKLGGELHGPEDWMEINRSHILFIEKLKADGRVAKAIEQYKKDHGK